MKKLTPNIYHTKSGLYFSFLSEEVVAAKGLADDVILGMKQEAFIAKEKWIYLVDQRVSNSNNAAGHDIIGAFEVKDQKIINFKPNDNYQHCSQDGFINFGEALNPVFYSYLLQRAS